MLVNIHQAKTNLSRLIHLVTSQQDEIIIGKMGKPVAKLIPYTPPKNLKPGQLKNKITIADDFDQPNQKLEKLFYDQ